MSKRNAGGKFLPPKSDVAFKELMRNDKVRRYFISDVLGIPLDEIREVRLENTFLGRRSKREKEGILDVKVLLNNDCRINIELQLREVPAWDKRSLFYLSKMYAEEAHTGEDYSPLKRCIVICVLGFKWDSSPNYHKIFYLKDQEGQLYSDQFEVHVIELDKELVGDQLDDWIRLFRVESMMELKLIQSLNPGVMEAVKEVMAMNLGKRLKALYEEHMRIKKDRIYLRNAAIQEGREIGEELGKKIGKEIGRQEGRLEGRLEGRQEGRLEGRQEGRLEGRLEGRQEGRLEGETIGDLHRRRQDILDLLEDLGEVPEDIRRHILAEGNTDILRKWLKTAARAESFASFRDVMK